METPIERARVAAEQLAAAGQAVTARAVRQASGVKMAVAVDVARQWNEARNQEVDAPPVPEAVQLRIEGVWREAYSLAQDEFEAERTGWAAKIATLTRELGEVTADLDDMEEKARKSGEMVDEARTRIAQAEAQATAAAVDVDRVTAELRAIQEQAATERTRADRAEARADAVAAEAERIRDELRAVQEQAAMERTRADRAEARADALAPPEA